MIQPRLPVDEEAHIRQSIDILAFELSCLRETVASFEKRFPPPARIMHMGTPNVFKTLKSIFSIEFHPFVVAIQSLLVNIFLSLLYPIFSIHHNNNCQDLEYNNNEMAEDDPSEPSSPNISSSSPSSNKLERFQRELQEEGIYIAERHTPALLKKFLSAKGNKVSKAKKMLIHCEEWRKKHNIDQIGDVVFPERSKVHLQCCVCVQSQQLLGGCPVSPISPQD